VGLAHFLLSRVASVLTTVLAIAASMLMVEGESACPSVSDVLLELERVGERGRARGTVQLDGEHVRLVALDGTVQSVEAVNEGTCDERAVAVAKLIHRWETVRPPPLVPEPVVRQLVDDEGGRGARVMGTTIGAAVGAAIPLLLSLLFSPRDRSYGLGLLGFFSVPVAALTALAGHYLGGGKGHFGWALLGAGLGVTGGLMLLLIDNPTLNDWTVPRDPVRVSLACMVALGAPVLALELSDTLGRRDLSWGITPVRGGAAVSLGGRF
jgi:hypothetical protein